MPETGFEDLYRLITARTGLLLDDNRRTNVRRITADLLGASASTPATLAQKLAHAPFTDAQWQRLLQAITVGETYFFRNKAHFAALRETVLPTLIARRRRQGNLFLRLWSAGCATGEEPYSLAILLRDLLPDFANWQISILGTDIDLANLERARRGLYRAWSFRGETPDYVRDRWFTPVGDHYELAAEIKYMAHFAPLNLLEDNYPSYDSGTMNIDVLLCRNVTIYFNERDTRAVAQRFLRALHDEGWLIVGHSEPLATNYAGFTPENHPNAVFYRKAPPEQAANAQPASTAPPPRPPVSSFVTTPPPAVPAPPPVTPPAPARPAPAEAPADDEERPDLWAQAKAAADRENWDDALGLLGQVEQAADDLFQPHVHYLRALILLQMGEASGALKALRQAIYCDPGFALAHYTLGDLYDKQGQARQAQRHWRSAQNALSDLSPEQPLPLTEELTVEMLAGLLLHRLGPDDPSSGGRGQAR